MKIAYISNNNIQSVLSWSGTIKNIFDYLDSIENIDIRPISVYNKKFEFIFKILYAFHSFFGFTKDPSRNVLHNKIIGRKLTRELKKGKFDVILSPGSLEVANLETNIPIVIWTDAVFKSLCKSYPQYSKLTKRQIKVGDYLENKALRKADKIIFAASWVLDDAINNYNVNPDKIKIIPFGANIEPIDKNSVLNLIEKRESINEINLLFIGADWQKKGGDLLLKIFEELSNQLNNIKLNIIGSKPEKLPNNKNIIFHGFLNKSIEKEKDTFDRVLKSSHYFILPTKAEAFGIVFCEANSFGIPVIGSDIGGIKDVIKEERNGIRIDINKPPNELAQQIKNYITTGSYKQKAELARKEYEDRLNWDVSIKKLINEMNVYP